MVCYDNLHKYLFSPIYIELLLNRGKHSDLYTQCLCVDKAFDYNNYDSIFLHPHAKSENDHPECHPTIDRIITGHPDTYFLVWANAQFRIEEYMNGIGMHKNLDYLMITAKDTASDLFAQKILDEFAKLRKAKH